MPVVRSQITDKMTVIKTDDKAVEMRMGKWLVIRFCANNKLLKLI